MIALTWKSFADVSVTTRVDGVGRDPADGAGRGRDQCLRRGRGHRHHPRVRALM